MKSQVRFLAAALVAALLPLSLHAAITPLINHGDTWYYHKGTNAPQTDWKTTTDAALNTSHWATGLGGFGYADNAAETNNCQTILSDMMGTAASNYLTVYMRKTFTISNLPAANQHLFLRMDFDDGYIAWLDGVYLTNRYVNGAPAEPAYTTNANASHECSTGNSTPQPAQTNDLGQASTLLGVGTHTLAIIGLNNSKTSTDLIEVADLYLDTVTVTGPSITGQPQSQTVTVGGNATFAVTNSGTAPFSYRWWFNTTNLLASATNSSLALTNVQFTNAGGYSVIVTNIAGAATSSVATLTVNPLATVTNGVGGTIAVNTTWYATNRFYTVTSSITVLSNVTLTIEPGVTVWTRTNCSINVYGTLLASGTTNQPITFTRYPTDLNWERLMFIEATNSVLRNCIVEYSRCSGDHKDAYYATNCAYPMNIAPRVGAKAYFEAVIVLACHLEIEGCTFRNLYDDTGTLPEGDAIGIFSDDLYHRGPASANIRGCQFLYIGQGVNTRYAYILVENCYFVGKTGDNDDVEMYGEPSLYGLPAPEVRNNFFDIPCYDDRVHPTRCSAIIHDNIIYGDPSHGDHCIVLRDTCCPIVFNNVMFNSPSGGISIQNGADALIANNTFYGINSAIKLFDHRDRIVYPYCLSAMSGRATVINCVIWNGNNAIDVSGSAGLPFQTFRVNISYSDIQNGTNNFTAGSNPNYSITWGPGIINTNPLFVDAANKNVHIATNSPCIDAGSTNLGVYVTTNTYFVGTNRLTYAVTNDLSLFVTHDLDSVARPLAGHGDGVVRYDLGAYEIVHPTADSNGDGLPDAWCVRYGFNALDPNLANGDPDHDFQNNGQEYLAGTNPTNAASYPVFPVPVGISSVGRSGTLSWSNASPAGVVSILTATNILGPWQPQENYFTTNPLGLVAFDQTSDTLFCRLLAVDLSTNTPRHYTNLIESYGVLETIAGKGQYNTDRTSLWSNSFEGGWATNANLSRPHIAFGDPFGNVLIVDQGSGAVEKVTPDGRIYTYAGTHTNGNNGDGPALATTLQLNYPNGGWMGPSGTFYVLDTENGKVRRIDTNGIMSTIFTTTPMGDGRALWVKSDESVIYFGSGAGVGANVTTLNKWTPTGGATVFKTGFLNMGNIVGDERTGDLYITDRSAYQVYRMDTNGTLTTIAGNGTATGGGDGFSALATGLSLPRTICFFNNGGYLIGEHDLTSGAGCRIWYVDPAGIIHLWMNGDGNGNSTINRRGDGLWFHANPATPKLTKVRSVTMDFSGNLIIVENNYGYVRRIKFQRMNP